MSLNLMFPINNGPSSRGSNWQVSTPKSPTPGLAICPCRSEKIRRPPVEASGNT